MAQSSSSSLALKALSDNPDDETSSRTQVTRGGRGRRRRSRRSFTAILPYKYVDHYACPMHCWPSPIRPVAKKAGPREESTAKDTVIVPYVMPGFDLARSNARASLRTRSPRGHHWHGAHESRHFPFVNTAKKHTKRMIRPRHAAAEGDYFESKTNAWALAAAEDRRQPRKVLVGTNSPPAAGYFRLRPRHPRCVRHPFRTRNSSISPQKLCCPPFRKQRARHAGPCHPVPSRSSFSARDPSRRPTPRPTRIIFDRHAPSAEESQDQSSTPAPRRRARPRNSDWACVAVARRTARMVAPTSNAPTIDVILRAAGASAAYRALAGTRPSSTSNTGTWSRPKLKKSGTRRCSPARPALVDRAQPRVSARPA